jgi:excisionase family DNA binding protein
VARMRNNTAVRDVAEAEHGASPVETANTLLEAREALEGYETSALADVAAMLAQTAESLARTARDLREADYDAWMEVDQAAAYLKRTPKTFRNIVASGEIPKHYLTERGILFSRKELDEWLINR